MAASLPISVALSRAPSRPAAAPALTGVPVASVKLPLAFILTGLGAMLFGCVWLVARPDLLATYHYNQYVIAATHLFVLGWLCSVVMGAMYQLVPVALETKLYSQTLAKVQFAFHVIGFIGMVWMFERWNMKQVGHFGCLLFLGVCLFVYNLVRTLLRVPRWTVTATGVTGALVWLSLTVTVGLCLATAKCSYEAADSVSTATWLGALLHGLRSIGSFMTHFDAISAMHAHAHLGVLGFFTILIVGVSYKLVPMFSLSEVQCRHRAGLSLVLLNIGVAGAFTSILLRSRWKLGFTFLVVLALAVYGWELVAMLRARKRRALDWGMKMFLTAVCLLGVESSLAVVLSWPGLPLNGFTGQLENLYGFLGLLGFVSLAVIGMLYKIVPFLVWFGTYSSRVGMAKVPSLAELYSARLQKIGFATYTLGLVITSVGIVAAHGLLVRFGTSLLCLSLGTLLLNIGLMLRHLFRPQLKPLPARTVAAPNAI
jgi:hypothetical protein